MSFIALILDKYLTKNISFCICIFLSFTVWLCNGQICFGFSQFTMAWHYMGQFFTLPCTRLHCTILL